MPPAPTRIIFEDREILVLHRPGRSAHSLVTFADLTFRPKGDAFWGREAAERLGLDAVGFVAKRENWYPAASVEAAAEAVRAVLKPRALAYGYSMGAYGALKHGRRLGFDAAIAVAPQVSIAPIDVPADTRFHRYYRPAVHRGMRVAPEDLAPFAAVLADPYDAVDWDHARLAAEAGPAHLLRTPHAGHSAIWLVTGAEALGELLAPALEGDVAAMRGLLRERRARSGHWFRLMGRAAFGHGHGALAETLWDRARALRIPDAILAQERARATADRAQRLLALGRRQEAVAMARDLAAAAPAEVIGAIGQAAHLLLAAGAGIEAEAAFRRALVLNPAAADVHVGLSLALGAQGRESEAIAAARDGHAAIPEDGETATHYAHLLAGGEAAAQAEAERIFRVVLARQPANGIALFGLSRVVAARGQGSEALHLAQQASARLPGHHDSLAWFAGLVLRGGDALRAERLYRRLQRLSPGRAEGYLGLAAALQAQGRRAEAIGALRRGLNAVPGDAVLAANLRESLRPRARVAALMGRLRGYFRRRGVDAGGTGN